MNLRWEWDEIKNVLNFKKHKLFGLEEVENMKKEYKLSNLKKRPGKVKTSPKAAKVALGNSDLS